MASTPSGGDAVAARPPDAGSAAGGTARTTAPAERGGGATAARGGGVAAPARRTRPGGTLYRGREGMWSWVAHRITGVLTFFFLFTHVLDIALVRVSPESFDRVIDTYKNPFINLMEVGLVGAVLYHALNGLRIIAVDFWARGARLQRQMLWVIVAVWVALMVPGAFFMLKHTVETLFGGS